MDNRITLAVLMLRKYRGFYTTINSDLDPRKVRLRAVYAASQERTLTIDEANESISVLNELRGKV